MFRFLTLITLLSLALAVGGCEKEIPVAVDTIVTVGERSITRSDFQRYCERNAGTPPDQLEPAAASALLDQFIDEVILSEHAAAQGIQFSTSEITAEVRNEPGSTIVEKTDELRRRRLLADLTARVPEPTAEEVRRYYDENRDEFRTGEQVHARQILLQSEEEAKKAQDELKKGTPFEEVSAKYSRAPNADRGGDIGFVGRGQLPRAFEDVLFSLQPGMISPTVKTNVNYFHIFKVESIQPPGTLPLEQAHPVIAERLREEGLRKSVEELLSSAGSRIPVKVLTKRLNFPYSGRHPKGSNE